MKPKGSKTMAVKASENFKTYRNPYGPVITTLNRPVMEKDGLYFKDIDGSGEVSAVNDWRLSPEERAAAYVKLLTTDEKIGQLFISDWRMGPKYPSTRLRGHVAQPDESGVLDEAEVHQETTLTGTRKIAQIAEAVHSRGRKVIANINFPLAWQVGNVERYADCLLAGFETYPAATLDVIFGRYNPTGKLPVTLPRGDAVLAVDANSVCISPNDVPGYDKDLYMPESMKDENGKAYAYRDAKGNYYELNFGLSY